MPCPWASSPSIPSGRRGPTTTCPCIRSRGPDGRPERVSGQYGIYDSQPGDPNSSPIWRYNDVVPCDDVANTLKSKEDCKASGYQIVQAGTFTN